MKRIKKITAIGFGLICLVLSSAVLLAAGNNNITHPNASVKYNENPAPIYTANDNKAAGSFVSAEKCLENITKTKESKVISTELKTWGKYTTDEKNTDVNYQVASDRMVRVIKVAYPDGLDTKAGFCKNAVLTAVFDAETGNPIESSVTGDFQPQTSRLLNP